MSIPKEPRQLMINLMYLVLTALLALNVSAEILNAFLLMNDSLTESSQITGHSNNKLMEAIATQADTYTRFEPFKAKAEQAQVIAKDFETYVDAIKKELVEMSGGYDEEHQLEGIKNKDVTTRMMVLEGKGMELDATIKAAREQLLALVDEEDRSKLAESIPLKQGVIPEGTDKKDWAQFTFQQMPLAAVLPILSKLQNDAKVAETTLLNHFLEKTGIVYKPDAFEAVISSDKSYVIKGESLNAEVFLGSYSSSVDNMTISVNGRNYPVRNGKAKIDLQPNEIGQKALKAKITMKDPLTGKVKTYNKEFVYEVGERSVTVSADKMNVFYMGVKNPLSISAAGVASAQVQVSADGVRINKIRDGKYIVEPNKPGISKITVSGGGLEPTTFEYRVKPIPNPTLFLGNKTGGKVSPGELKVYDRLNPIIERFDFETRCRIVGFEMTRVPKGRDIMVATNPGGKFKEQTKRILSNSKAGDTVYFDKVKAKCPGDKHDRQLNGMVFHVR